METLEAIKLWFSENAPKVLEEHTKPASESDIKLVEEETGIKLPEDFVNFLRTQNGANGVSPLFGDGHELLTCQQIIAVYKYGLKNHKISTDDLLQYQEWKELASENLISINGPVKPHESHTNWLPISDQNGDILRYLDFDPAKGGTLGQVIEVDWECFRWQVLAPSFKAFLSKYYDELINGHYEVDEFGGVAKKVEYYADTDLWGVPDWLLTTSEDLEYVSEFNESDWHLDLRLLPMVDKLLSSEFPVDLIVNEWQDCEPSKIDSNFYELTWKNDGLFIAFCTLEGFAEIATKIKAKSKKMNRVRLSFTLLKHNDPSNKKSHPKWKCWLEATNVKLI